MITYTILSTYPGQRSSANVGDQLIELAVKRLIERERGPVRFVTIFREDPLEDRIAEVNATAAILLPGCAIRDTPMHPRVYRLTADLDRLSVPLIPIGANWNTYPGDAESRRLTRWPAGTLDFVRRLASRVAAFSCREHHVVEMLARHGIGNGLMTGDPAWYDPDAFGRAFHRPREVRTVAFSPPLSAFYRDQGAAVLRLLRDLFPAARRYCAMHLTDRVASPFADRSPTNDASMRADVAEKNAFLRREAAQLGFEVIELAGDVERLLRFYPQCDLHVGYECHAHVSMFRIRRPSVLIAEDARGVGFNDTFGAGGFTGFVRRRAGLPSGAEVGGTSGYCVTSDQHELAPARTDLIDELEGYLRAETSTCFRRYLGVGPSIDETYSTAMAPFLRSLPG